MFADPGRPRLLLAVAHDHGGIEYEGDGPGHLRPTPAGADQVPGEMVEQRRKHGTAATEPPAECGRMRHLRPAKEPSNLTPLEPPQVVEPAAPVEQQRDPQFHHERGAVVARKLGGPGLEPAAQVQMVPQVTKGEQGDSVGELGPVVAEPDRAGRTLHVGAGTNMLYTHRLGDLGCRESHWREPLVI